MLGHRLLGSASCLHQLGNGCLDVDSGTQSQTRRVEVNTEAATHLELSASGLRIQDLEDSGFRNSTSALES